MEGGGQALLSERSPFISVASLFGCLPSVPLPLTLMSVRVAVFCVQELNGSCKRLAPALGVRLYANCSPHFPFRVCDTAAAAARWRLSSPLIRLLRLHRSQQTPLYCPFNVRLPMPYYARTAFGMQSV